MFYGHTQASEEDLKGLSKVLGIPEETLRQTELLNFPDRGRSLEMPPREPLVYRLYEIVQNYGYAYKSVINEKFGDGIMSAISFSTKVEKETDDKGDWVKITLRGKWCVYSDFLVHVQMERGLTCYLGSRSPASRCWEKMYINDNRNIGNVQLSHALVSPLQCEEGLAFNS